MTASERIREARGASWHLIQLTEATAEAHDRRIHNCGPEEVLGWKPYTYLATRGAVSQWACHDEWQLKVKLAANRIKVTGWTDWRDGMRIAKITEL